MSLYNLISIHTALTCNFRLISVVRRGNSITGCNDIFSLMFHALALFCSASEMATNQHDVDGDSGCDADDDYIEQDNHSA